MSADLEQAKRYLAELKAPPARRQRRGRASARLLAEINRFLKTARKAAEKVTRERT